MNTVWNNKSLAKASLQNGKTKTSIRDPKVPGLYFEIRKRSKSFVFRMTKRGNTISKTLGQFPNISIQHARKMALELRSEILLKKTDLGMKKSLTLNQFVDSYYRSFSRNHHKQSRQTLALYNNHIKSQFGEKRLDQIDRLSVYQWVNSLQESGYKNTTINKIMVLFGQILGLARKTDMPGAPEKDKFHLKLMPVRPSHTVFLAPDQVDSLLSATRESSNPNLHDITSILIFTGARKREALDARWCDVDLVNQLWTIPTSKSGSPRYILLGENATQVFRARQYLSSDSEFVFPNPKTGKPYKCIFFSWKVAREYAGMPELRIHDLRHSFASALVNSGIPLYDVQSLLGHQSFKTTQRYAHLSRERLKASAGKIDQFYQLRR